MTPEAYLIRTTITDTEAVAVDMAVWSEEAVMAIISISMHSCWFLANHCRSSAFGRNGRSSDAGFGDKKGLFGNNNDFDNEDDEFEMLVKKYQNPGKKSKFDFDLADSASLPGKRTQKDTRDAFDPLISSVASAAKKDTKKKTRIEDLFGKTQDEYQW